MQGSHSHFCSTFQRASRGRIQVPWGWQVRASLTILSLWRSWWWVLGSSYPMQGYVRKDDLKADTVMRFLQWTIAVNHQWYFWNPKTQHTSPIFRALYLNLSFILIWRCLACLGFRDAYNESGFKITKGDSHYATSARPLASHTEKLVRNEFDSAFKHEASIKIIIKIMLT